MSEPFVSPMFAWSAASAGGTCAQFPHDAQVLMKRVGRQTVKGDVVIGGWESFASQYWRSEVVLGSAYQEGRALGLLEGRTAVQVAVVVFARNPRWRGGNGEVVFNACADNLGNSHVRRRSSPRWRCEPAADKEAADAPW